MGRSTSETVIRRKLEVTPYGGENERLNAILDDETVFVVQGSYGRIPLIADTAEDAIEQYVAKFASRIEAEEVTEEEE